MPQPESTLRILHYDTTLTPDDWVDVTTSLDTLSNVICGRTATLSPFLLGLVSVTGVAASQAGAPERFALHQNAPNPFNPTTVIRYDVPPGGAKVTIQIYDVAGRLVETLIDDPQSAGHRSVRWNGRNQHGHSVATGVYFYRMKAGQFVQTKKMVVLK